MIRVKSSKFTVTAKEEIPWVLDGEFGGSVIEAKIENVKEAVTLSCSPEPEKQERRRRADRGGKCADPLNNYKKC